MRRTAGSALAAAILTLLAACGDDEPTTASDPSAEPDDTSSQPTEGETAEVPDWPSCAEIWVDGADLPQGYKGCLDGDTEVKADRQPCSSGQVLVTYDERFYAVVGGPVNETEGLAQDSQYRSAKQSCLA